MEQDIKGRGAAVPHREIVETLRLAAQGYVIRNSTRGAFVHPMPWRRILHQLYTMGPDDSLEIGPAADGDDIAVRRIVPNGRVNSERPAVNGSRATICTVNVRAGLRARARFAQRVETAVRSGECRCVTCMRTGVETIGASAPALRPLDGPASGDRKVPPLWPAPLTPSGRPGNHGPPEARAG